MLAAWHGVAEVPELGEAGGLAGSGGLLERRLKEAYIGYGG